MVRNVAKAEKSKILYRVELPDIPVYRWGLQQRIHHTQAYSPAQALLYVLCNSEAPGLAQGYTYRFLYQQFHPVLDEIVTKVEGRKSASLSFP